MSVAEAIDTAGVAVITGGASGFGLVVAERLLRRGMAVAILDVSADELVKSEEKLRALGSGKVLAIRCDVTKFDDCTNAKKEVAAGFPNIPVSFLFNNAGIFGSKGGAILSGSHTVWNEVFSVNVFGAVYIIKAFLPDMIAGGPLPSGKKSLLVTTSSVVGLLNHGGSAYGASKMAVTALCEQLAMELESMGPRAAHVSPHTLHPTMCGTNFFTGRGADGKPGKPQPFRSAEFVQELVKLKATTADEIADGMFQGLDEGKYYIVVDHPLDIPTSKQVAVRMEDQMTGRRPRGPEPLAAMLKLGGDAKAFSRRVALMEGQSPESRL